MQKVTLSSAAAETANVLREIILAEQSEGADPSEAPEWFLGSEVDMMAQLGVSRPTLRQGLRLLEQEQLVSVRRGIGGGIFARRPSVEGVTHTASVFLRSVGTTYSDLIGTLSLLAGQSARLAAENPDESERRRLLEFYEEKFPNGIDDSVSPKSFVERSGEFEVLLAEISGSPTLRLFVSVLIDLALPAAAQIVVDPEHMRASLRNHLAVAKAVAEGNGALAARRLKNHLASDLLLTDETTSLMTLYPRVSGRRS